MINGKQFFDPLSIITLQFRADESLKLIKHFYEQYG